jgi:hypothetical protein
MMTAPSDPAVTFVQTLPISHSSGLLSFYINRTYPGRKLRCRLVIDLDARPRSCKRDCRLASRPCERSRLTALRVRKSHDRALREHRLTLIDSKCSAGSKGDLVSFPELAPVREREREQTAASVSSITRPRRFHAPLDAAV